MNSTSDRQLRLVAAIALAIGGLAPVMLGQSARDEDRSGHHFRLTSSTFADNTFLPISTIHNVISNGINACSVDGTPGGNQSPELFWTGAPGRTRTFVVTAYDETAAFTHWGMYNIPGSTTELPENAGAAGSPYGTPILNNFGDAAYDGPCPPPNLAPYIHHYAFTVYALDIELELPSYPNFPATAVRLYQALIEAGQRGHILASASITGLYSTNPSAQ